LGRVTRHRSGKKRSKNCDQGRGKVYTSKEERTPKGVFIGDSL